MPKLNINSLTAAQIKEHLRSRGLSSSGNKAELVLRLVDNVGSDELDVSIDERNENAEIRDAVAGLTALVEKLRDEVRVLSENARSETNIQSSTPVTQPPIRDIRLNSATSRLDRTSLFHSARDVIDLLPDFDPRSNSSLTSAQFVKRVRQLSSAYSWDDNLVIFAVQAKLKGPAKLWLDSIESTFDSFDQFARDFERQFRCTEDVADVHMRMAANRRKSGESITDYYYRMCADGKRNGLPDVPTIKYIRQGLNHHALQTAMSCLSFTTTEQLFECISTFLSNKQQIEPTRRVFTPQPEPLFTDTVPTDPVRPITRRNRPDSEKQQNLCFNCWKPGHISLNCPLPQRRPRCAKCLKVGHATDKCGMPEKRDGNVNRLKSTPTATPERKESNSVTRTICINGQSIDAFVDIGSDRTLIRESAAASHQPEICVPVTMKGFAGGSFTCTKKVIATLSLDECNVDAELYVVDDQLIPNAILLGADALLSDSKRVIIDSKTCRVEGVQPIEVNVSTKLTDAELAKFRQLLENFRQCFAQEMSEIGRSRTTTMSIELTTEKPISSRPYRIPLAKRTAVDTIIAELLANNIIRPSESGYSSPIVLVKKQNGEDRLCIDYRAVNSVTRKMPFPMPTVDEILAQIAGNTFYTTLDLFSGYYQIPLDQHSRKYTAFVTHSGHYEYAVMPFGLVNAPMVFQQLITKLIYRMKSDKIVSYMDEVIICSTNIAEGMSTLTKFLEILKEEGLTLRPSKCTFFETKIFFLGHEITADGIKPGKIKTDAIVNYPRPTNIHDVRSYLGLTGFFRKFIRDYSIIAKPLTSLLKTKTRPEFKWDEHCESAFNKLKSLMSAEPILALYNQNEQHEVHTDASAMGLAGVLMQSSDKVNWRPVFYFSRQCNEAEQKYHSHELEVLAIVESLERFRFHLLGKHFRVITDCRAISTTKLSTPLNNRIARWWLKLQEYDFEVVHRAADRMHHVDAMSRYPTETSVEVKNVAENVLIVEIEQIDWLGAMQQQDPKLKTIIDVLTNKSTSPQSSQIKKEFCLKRGRLMRKEGVECKFVVPAAARWRIVRSYHDELGHVGCEKALKRLQELFWFSRMRRYMKSYIASCIECCYNKVPSGKKEGRMFYEQIEPVPFRVLHIDHLGPFPRTRKANAYIIAISDPFSKFTIVRAVRNSSAKYAVQLLNEISTYFGLPVRIISDRGSAFTSHEFEQFCGIHDIQHVKIPVRTPRANGQVERVNQTILAHLRCSSTDKKSWDTLLQNIQWSLNSQPHSTTGFSPNQIVFDFRLRDVTSNRMIQALNDDRTESPDLPITEIRQQAVERIMNEKRRWKQRYDEKHKKPHVYNEGDLIVIENTPSATGESHKLEPKYKGPYIVSKVLRSDRYVIEDLADMRGRNRKYSSVFTADKMKPWCHLSPDIDSYNDESDEDSEIEAISRSGVAELSTQ